MAALLTGACHRGAAAAAPDLCSHTATLQQTVQGIADGSVRRNAAMQALRSSSTDLAADATALGQAGQQQESIQVQQVQGMVEVEIAGLRQGNASILRESSQRISSGISSLPGCGVSTS